MSVIAVLLILAQARAPEILERHCLKCHNERTHKGDLDLSTREAVTIKPETIWRSVAHLEEPYMPHRAPKLPDADLAELKKWLDSGMKYERPLKAPGAAEAHWAFAPLRAAGDGSIDDIVRKALAAKGLAMNREASRVKQIRRVTFDVTGLPPAPEEIEAFLKDRSPGAYEALVDRLLASPHYGERWGRHWLDVARYADSSGYESDYDQKSAYHYRDFVIRALNEDLPFDTFVRWQIAGDEIDPGNPQAVAATGFCTVGPYLKTLPTDTPRNKQIYRNDELDDIVVTASAAFLGLTVGCARCHDHKFDPIPSRDYYRLTAVFAPSRRGERSLSLPQRRLEEWREARRTALRDARIEALPLAAEEKEILRAPKDTNIVSSARLHKEHGAKVAVSDDDLRQSLSDAEREEWKRLEEAARAAGPSLPRALSLADAPGPPARHFWLGRGDPDLPKEEVRPGVLTALTPGAPDLPSTSRRSALAGWITDLDRGAGRLLARVAVNRVWQHHFGEGLVRTPSDFGTQGDPPTHPELLDTLAARLAAQGWRLKALHKAILMSDVYRQDTTFDAARAAVDPENRLLWRRRPLRLEAETLRDALLAVSGRLDRRLYGPAVKLPIPADAIATRTKDEYPKAIEDGPATWRRTIYAFVKRSVINPMMEMNDGADTSASCGRRARTTVAPQALMLLNDPFVRGCARDLARRAAGDPARAVLLALGRGPRESELATARAFQADLFVDFCHALLTLNEFFYVD